MRSFNTSLRQNADPARNVRVRSIYLSQVAKLDVNIGGRFVTFHVFVDDLRVLRGANDSAEFRLLFAGTVDEIVDQMKGLIERRTSSSKPKFAIETTRLSQDFGGEFAAPAKKTELLVGGLHLDLIDRVAARDGRRVELRPCEFRLLKYMMERSGSVVTRVALLQELWHYKFVPKKSNLVDVHMGKLRRKIDGPNEPPMIRCITGAGFVLDAAP